MKIEPKGDEFDRPGEHSNRADAKALVDSFTTDALLVDSGRRFHG
jgi:hypothetical protein